MFNTKQVQNHIDNDDYSLSSAYERTADGLGWFYYPCDDHVIRVVLALSGWYAHLTTMRDRTTILHASSGLTRKAAVLNALKWMVKQEA